jgi:hypothetical protein
MSNTKTTELFDWNNLSKNLQNTIGAKPKKEVKSFEDERFWTMSKDENGNGSAIIRLIPDKNGMPFIKMFKHGFKKFDTTTKRDRWFIEASPSSIGEKCPASEMWYTVSKNDDTASKDLAKLLSRKVEYVTNVLVVKDPANPENNGKVFLWKFGVKLFDKFMSKLNPSADEIELGVEAVNLYHPVEGANIMLKIKQGAGGFFNYDDTSVMNKSQAFATIAEAKDIITTSSYPMQEFLEKDYYKTYDELKDKLEWVLGLKEDTKKAPAVAKEVSPTAKASTIDTDFLSETEEVEAPVAKKEAPVKKEAPKADDEDLDFLNDL